MSQLAGQALLGTCGWSYDDWQGNFYPEKITSKARLTHYAQQFRTVEIDSTFYGIPTREVVQSWRERVPEGFIFSAKFPRVITHDFRLQDCGEIADKFVDIMSELGPHMGPLVLQLPPSLDRRAIGRLARLLEGLPDGYAYAVEIRHRSWLVDEFADLLKRWQVALVLPDGSRLERFWRVTSKIVYIRWLGAWDAYSQYDRIQRDVAEDIAWWAPRIRHVLDRGGIVLGYVNNNFAGHSPSVVQALNKSLAQG